MNTCGMHGATSISYKVSYNKYILHTHPPIPMHSLIHHDFLLSSLLLSFAHIHSAPHYSTDSISRVLLIDDGMYLILAPGTMCMATDQWKVYSFISFIHLLSLSLFSMSLMNHIRDLVESSHYKTLSQSQISISCASPQHST